MDTKTAAIIFWPTTAKREKYITKVLVVLHPRKQIENSDHCAYRTLTGSLLANL